MHTEILDEKDRLRIESLIQYTEEEKEKIKNLTHSFFPGIGRVNATASDIRRLTTIEGILEKLSECKYPQAVVYYIDFVDGNASLNRTCVALRGFAR